MVPLTDRDVPGWWQQLGLPGLVDIDTHFLPERMMRPDLLPRLADLPDRVVLGSDFPNIPYAYAHHLEAPERLRHKEPCLDDDWLRGVCWFNGQRLIGGQPL